MKFVLNSFENSPTQKSQHHNLQSLNNNLHQQQIMTVTLSTIATEELARDLASAAAQKKRWKSNSIAHAQGWLAKLLTETVRRNDGQAVTLGKLLCADALD